jgi:hypothetical protein
MSVDPRPPRKEAAVTADPSLHRLSRALAAAMAVAALGAPPAVARPIDTPRGPVRIDPGPIVVVEPEQAPARPPVVQKIDDGFDWGSAAIGAGATGALVVIVALGGVAYTTRHRLGAAR